VSTIRRNGRPLYTGIVRDASELRQAEASRRAAAAAEAANSVLQRDEQRLRWLNEIGQHAEAADNVDAVLRCGLDAVCGFTGWPVGHAWVPAEDDQVLVSSGFWSIADEGRYAAFRDDSAAIRFTAEAGGLIGSVLGTRQAVWIDDIEKVSLMVRQRSMIAAGLHAACAVPILSENEIEAVLEFFSPEIAAPDPHFLEFLKQAGTMLGAIVRRKRDAAELRKLALIVRETDNAVVITGPDRRIEWVNPGFTAITGYLLSEVAGRRPSQLLHGPETDPATVVHLRQALDAGRKVEAEIVNYAKSGRKFWMRLSVQPIFDQGGKIERYVAIEQDVTERKRSEDALRDKEEELRSVVDNLVDGVISIDTKGIVCSYNGSAERIFGYRADEVVGRNINMLMPEPHHTAHDSYLEKHVRTGEKKIIGIGREVEGRRKDGTLFPVDLAVSSYSIKGERFFTGILRDITERKRVTEALQSAMHGAEESSRAKSAFLAAMSHELRTPMNGVVGMIDVLCQTELDADQREMMGTARESAFSLLGVIDDVLDFSKIEAGKLELERVPVSLAKVVEGVCETLLPIAHKKQVELIVFCDPRLPGWVLADPVRLRQVLFNLAGNAVKFSGSEAGRTGRVFIRADLLAATDERVKVSLQIADNGIGMDEAAVTRLFQPFTQAESSTTRRFGGTGLGLSICSRLVELMDGTIGVQSAPGEGSVFRVELDLPQVSGRAVQSLPFKLDDLEVVLLAGDTEMREILDRYLGDAGIHVLAARSADEAVRHADAAVADRSPLVIVIDDAGGEPALATLGDRLAGRAAKGIVRYVVVQRGRRRKARGNDDSSVTLDANAMRRMSFLRAVAIAAGRASPEQDTAPAELTMAVAAPVSVAEAERAGRLILIAEDNKTNQKVILRQLA
ncbi:MAG TPA: PAS domain S-box protein, partial [Rhodocyclaceae bacterium]|nr:PAS domain S-box protein [Rhodocyclaceae bacterium]